jgi:hypothetical protein
VFSAAQNHLPNIENQGEVKVTRLDIHSIFSIISAIISFHPKIRTAICSIARQANMLNAKPVKRRRQNYPCSIKLFVLSFRNNHVFLKGGEFNGVQETQGIGKERIKEIVCGWLPGKKCRWHMQNL